MIARFTFKARQLGLLLRAVLIALLAMLTGCDKKVAWRSVGTDSQDAERSPDQQLPQRNATNVKTE
jgi:hypothetical protein